MQKIQDLCKHGQYRNIPVKKKSASQRGSGNKVPSHLNESPFANRIAEPTPKGKSSDKISRHFPETAAYVPAPPAANGADAKKQAPFPAPNAQARRRFPIPKIARLCAEGAPSRAKKRFTESTCPHIHKQAKAA